MAGVFALLGVDIDHAIAAAVMYRVVYFFIPFAATVFFYRHILARPQAEVPVLPPRIGGS
jgi:uncharacterized membrane protein YbhN (UPF0104 family)